MNIDVFYDELAADYDMMTDFDARFEKEEPLFQQIVGEHSIATALDAGAGTGFHSLLLAKLGVQVTAVDISAEMLTRLSENAERMRLSVNLVQSPFHLLHEKVHQRFDAVFCLGNSLPHVLSDNEMNRTLANFYSLLNPGGILFIQILNYDKIMRTQERVLNIKKRGNALFIRFYDYCDERIRFNILKLIDRESKVDHTIHTVELRPIRKDDLEDFLSAVGFDSIAHYGSLELMPFDTERSPNLVTIAKKP